MSEMIKILIFSNLQNNTFTIWNSLYLISYVMIYWSTEAVARRSSVKKVLKISQNSQENTCVGFSFLIKLQALGLQLY